MQQLRQFWMDDHLCDVVLKSHDGAEHRAHTAVLSAASAFFKNLLGGSFLEAERVQQKQPVEIAASKAAVSAHCWTTSMMGSLKYQWKLVLNSYDWQRLTTCQS